MDPDKFKSVAINIKTYQLLEELSQKRFELPISMSKTVEFYVQKGHEDYKGKDAKKKKLHNRLEELESSRQDQYGSFEENMNKIASSWSIILDKHLIAPIEGWQVPLLYAQAKLIRATHKFKEDSYDDALAYIVQAHDMHKEKSEEIDTDELLGMEAKPRAKW